MKAPHPDYLDLITFEAIQEEEPAPCIELVHQWCKDIYMAAFDVEDHILRLLGDCVEWQQGRVVLDRLQILDH